MRTFRGDAADAACSQTMASVASGKGLTRGRVDGPEFPSLTVIFPPCLSPLALKRCIAMLVWPGIPDSQTTTNRPSGSAAASGRWLSLLRLLALTLKGPPTLFPKKSRRCP